VNDLRGSKRTKHLALSRSGTAASYIETRAHAFGTDKYRTSRSGFRVLRLTYLYRCNIIDRYGLHARFTAHYSFSIHTHTNDFIIE
jgi:hypothetical protein